MKNPVVRTLKNWLPALVGFLTAASLIVWMRPVPPPVNSLRAVLFIYIVATAGVLIIVGLTFLAASAVRFALGAPLRLTWGIASRAAWAVPLYLFIVVKSGWALVVAALLMLGLVHVLRNLQPAAPQTRALSSIPQVILCVLAGAAIELGIVATGTDHARQAVPFIALATLIIAWRATKPGRSGHPARGLITVFLAIVLSSGALVWRVGLRDGDGFLGFPVDPLISMSVFSLQKTFGGGRPAPFVPNRPEVAKGGNPDVKIAGEAHKGIFLWPEEKKETILVPPLPNLGRMAFGKDHRTPLTIPFYGAYWFFRPPYLQPPFGSLVIHGSPALKQFLSNDGWPLWEEAHQDLMTTFDLSCCSRIEVDVTNADHQPDLVEIELTLVERGHAVQSIGRKRLVTKPESVAMPETLEYPIPVKSKVTKMDELVVRFRLVAPRLSESAQVAIERFRLIPRGMR